MKVYAILNDFTNDAPTLDAIVKDLATAEKYCRKRVADLMATWKTAPQEIVFWPAYEDVYSAGYKTEKLIKPKSMFLAVPKEVVE